MIEDIIKQDYDFSFFQAVYLIEKQYKQEKNSHFTCVGGAKYPWDERLHFLISPELGFPRSDIRQIREVERHNQKHCLVEVNFSGLHGSGSPLPSSYTEKLAGREGEDNPVREFLDFFHNRYLSFFYRIWKKYRYHVIYESGAEDPLSSTLFNFVGLSSEGKVRDSLHLDWAKLLSYIGQLSTRTRSPDLVSGIVAHCFGMHKVDIEQWVLRKVQIDATQLNKLGQQNCTLGEDWHVGDYIYDISGKFNLFFRDLDFKVYERFLPGAEGYSMLRELMRFILRDPMAWDLKLELKAGQLPNNSLGRENGNILGRTLWLGSQRDAKEVVTVIGD